MPILAALLLTATHSYIEEDLRYFRNELHLKVTHEKSWEYMAELPKGTPMLAKVVRRRFEPRKWKYMTFEGSPATAFYYVSPPHPRQRLIFDQFTDGEGWIQLQVGG